MDREGFDLSSHKEPVPADYLQEFGDGSELSEAQQLELLGVLFEIMKSFVLMGYGMEPVNKLIETFESCASDTPDLIEFDNDESDGSDE